MAVHPRFSDASWRAEHCLDSLFHAQQAAHQSNQEEARRILQEVADCQNSEWFQTLQGMNDDLAAVADGAVSEISVTMPGDTQPMGFRSGHEAVVFFRHMVCAFFSCDGWVPGDLFDRWGVNLSYLRAHLQRERTKLLGQGATGNDQRPTTKPEASLDARAVGVFLEHRDWTKKQIASLLQCNEKSLCPKRCPQLAAAITAYKNAAAGSLPRGRKDKDGNLEAWRE